MDENSQRGLGDCDGSPRRDQKVLSKLRNSKLFFFAAIRHATIKEEVDGLP